MNNLSRIDFVEAKEGDLDIILDIYNYYIKNTTVLFDYDKITTEELKSRIFINNNIYKTYLVYLDNEIAGFCFLTQFRNKMAYEKTVEIGLYLKSQFTGKGLGVKVVKYLENIARRNKFELIIASISGDNTQSIKLFRNLEYKQCAHYKGIAIKFERKVDIVDFQKTI